MMRGGCSASTPCAEALVFAVHALASSGTAADDRVRQRTVLTEAHHFDVNHLILHPDESTQGFDARPSDIAPALSRRH